jgi:catechol 2,3-dioxygenase-like lactoylglutathione lyase family enzyme
MHRSRFAGLIIDCKTDDLEAAADFWSAALGCSRKGKSEDDLYVGLNTPENEPYIEVQKVDHPSRVHLDIEADDIEAEVKRLEALGARRIADVKNWCVMEAPSGQRFCIIPAESINFAKTANEWN